MENSMSQKDKRNNWIAGIVTFFLMLIVLVICFFLVAFSMPDPPPGETFVSVGMADFGNFEEGSGNEESENPSEVEQDDTSEESASSETVETIAAEQIVTQETAEVITPASQQATADPTPNPNPEPTVSKGLGSILDKINEGQGGGASNGQSQSSGNSGNPNGDIDGKGVVQGEGIGWALSGRGLEGKPKLSEDPTEDGRVVLDIYVDRSGNVVETRPNYNKSNTTSSYLFDLAKKAAKKAKFSVKNNAPPKQKGEMTFNFKLK